MDADSRRKGHFSTIREWGWNLTSFTSSDLHAVAAIKVARVPAATVI